MEDHSVKVDLHYLKCLKIKDLSVLKFTWPYIKWVQNERLNITKIGVQGVVLGVCIMIKFVGSRIYIAKFTDLSNLLLLAVHFVPSQCIAKKLKMLDLDT